MVFYDNNTLLYFSYFTNLKTLKLSGYYTGLFVSPSEISELGCATTKIDTAERNILIGTESVQVFRGNGRRGVLAGFTARGQS
jgi:hypothetical protein